MCNQKSTLYRTIIAGGLCGLCLCGTHAAWSDEAPSLKQANPTEAEKTASKENPTAPDSELRTENLTTKLAPGYSIDHDSGPLYVLPKVGKPRNRVGGGRRSAGAALPDVYALVPDHVGRTSTDQPVLYWYLSAEAPATVKFELTLLDEESIDPLVDTTLTTPAESGLQRVALADHGVRLKSGEEYQWSIAIVSDEENRSDDLVSSGWIERVSMPGEFVASADEASQEDRVRVYAQAGLWYDALDAACTLVSQHPNDPRAKSPFERLLAEAALPLQTSGHAKPN
jgi:hypothetical protein